MKFGVREICDVVLKAKSAQKIGNKVFYKNEPVIYFDSLKTSSLEGAATTVYAQGGRGNSRLVAWEGERTVTFTMEDALISPEGFMILSGAGLIEASSETPVYQHMMETTDNVIVLSDAQAGSEEFLNMFVDAEGNNIAIEAGDIVVLLKSPAYLPRDKKENFAYVMLTEEGMPYSEPIIPYHTGATAEPNDQNLYPLLIKKEVIEDYWCPDDGEEGHSEYRLADGDKAKEAYLGVFYNGMTVLVDYYTEKTSGARQIEITPDKFGGNYYLEASTLFRDTNGVDMPAEFIIPNCKIQSNFTFTMASSGDPSTFTFTMDAFPDYTRFDKSKKVLAAIQIIDVAGSMTIHRHSTVHEANHENYFLD